MGSVASPRNGKRLGLSVAATLAIICAGVAAPGHIARAQDSGLRSSGSRTKVDKSATAPIPQKLLAEQAAQRADGTRLEWCQTQVKWEKKVGVRGSVAAGCPTEGACDTPSIRDSWIPGGSDPTMTLRIKFNVFCNTDGTSCAATQASVDAQVVQLNSDFAPSKIQFMASTEFINNTTYRQFADSEEFAMKSAYADSPATQLNVYVVNISAGYLGVGTFTWDPDATGTQGGLIIDDSWFGAGQKTLTHEVGHCVGLWHTHHGVSEVAQCSDCWERADGLEGDITGDFASDTAPTPTNYNCPDPAGSDPCSGASWAPTDPQNYMSYAPDSCYTEFSPQQFGREHCWVDAELTGWIEAPCNTDPECDDGRYCNGVETCAGGSCQAGTSPCGGAPCDEATDTCATLAYEWNLNTNPGWTMQGQWAHGQPTGGGGQYGGPDPTGGATGANVLGYNLAGDYANNLPETHLTSTAIDCSSLTDVTLQFQRWLGVEVSTYDHAYVLVSNNGSNWTTIWQNTGEVAEAAWSTQEYDISAVADNQATVYLRWTMGTTDTSWQYCGWNIDDIQLYAVGGGCQTDPECDDGVACNGAETCAGGTCQAGTPVNCDDGVSCTDDACTEPSGSCSNVANDANCDDGVACNGAETCDAVLNCQAGTAIDCDDGVACTTDACNEPGGTCSNTPDNGACDDGVFCNGSETCDAVFDCEFGTPPSCDDGVGCTDDSCNAGTDSCDSIANNANCPDDGLFCNGAESCDPVVDCVSSGDPCTGGAVCNEGTDTCDLPACNNDGTCDPGEDCNNCPGDCISGSTSGAVCGNGVCEAGDGEDCVICPDDCNGRQGGKPSNRFCCGDGDGQNPLPCGDATCSTGGWLCTDTPAGGGSYCCGDLTCEGAEDFTNCGVDCSAPFCGDGNCDPGEDQCNCDSDCGLPPATETNCSDGVDNDCDGLTDADDPDCDCGLRGDACSIGADCCSGNCKRNGTCK